MKNMPKFPLYKIIGLSGQILLLVVVCLSGRVHAQKAVASLDTSSIRIGEQVQMKLDATLPRNARVHWPVLADTAFAPVEIVGHSKVDTVETSRNAYLQFRQILTVTCFDSGYKTIPPIPIEYQLPGDTARLKTFTDSLVLHVRTVEVDTTKAIRDIKAPLQAPLSLSELRPFFTGIALVGLIVAAIWYYLWRRKLNKPLFPVIRKPQLPPWQYALEAFSSIEGRKLWQNGRVKEYHTEITDVLRQYLENQFRIPAMEMISTDIMEAIATDATFETSAGMLWQILELADLVKFAKEMPLPAENDRSLSNARNFVLNTKPAETATKVAGSENDNLPVTSV